MAIRYSVLTYIFGDYERLHEIDEKDPEAEYILVTDRDDLQSDTWDIVLDRMEDSTVMEKCYHVRFHPFRYAHTDCVVRLDSSIGIRRSLRPLVDRMLDGKYDRCLMIHPARATMPEEYDAWVRLRGYSRAQANKCLRMMASAGYDMRYRGLFQGCFEIVMKNTVNEGINVRTYKLLEDIAEDGRMERVDQTVLSFVINSGYSKTLKVMPVSQNIITDGKFMQWYYHGTDKAVPDSSTIPPVMFGKPLLKEDIMTSVPAKPLDVLIVHYNTVELTKAAIRSLWKHTPNARVTVFDNSDRRPFPYADFPSVTYIDNTHGQIVDWKKWLAGFRKKVPCLQNDYASAKHCYSVELCLDRFPDGFLLMDSDVLVKKDVSPLCNSRYAWVGDTHTNTQQHGVTVYRVIPFLCYINTPLLRKHGIRYFDRKKMWGLTPTLPYSFYDTGAALLDACNGAGLEGLRVNLDDYIVHFGHASWKGKTGEAWLEMHRHLWHEDVKCRIYVCTHTDFTPVVTNPVYEVVDARKINNDRCENGLRGSFYSELFIYKYLAEREDLPQYVGFCGYRKYFEFMDDIPDIPGILSSYGAIAATPITMRMSVKEHYAKHHNIEDLNIVTDIIGRDYPDLWPYFHQSLYSIKMYACNMFIVRREDFREMVRIVFDILDKYLEKVGTDIQGRIVRNAAAYHIGMTEESTQRYQYRIGGYLAERIVNALLRQRFKRIKHFRKVVTQPAVTGDSSPLTKQ